MINITRNPDTTWQAEIIHNGKRRIIIQYGTITEIRRAAKRELARMQSEEAA